MQTALQRLTRAERLLSTIASAPDALKVSRLAEAARVYARQVNLGLASINHATTIKLLAERRLATIVDDGQVRGEIRKAGRRAKSNPPHLGDLGINYRRLAEARQFKVLSEAEIREAALAATEAGVELSRSAMIRESRRRAKGRKRRSPAEIAKADPARKWYEAIHRVYSLIIGSREAGGIEQISKGWTTKQRQVFVSELKELRKELEKWERKLARI